MCCPILPPCPCPSGPAKHVAKDASARAAGGADDLERAIDRAADKTKRGVDKTAEGSKSAVETVKSKAPEGQRA